MLETFRIRALCRSLVARLGPSGSTLALAESCTGGLISAFLTEVPGSSALLWGGAVVYSNEAKQALAGVSAATLAAHGAVSGETVGELLDGCLRRSGASLAAAVSGIAGPGGGSPEKPVGTVWIGAASSSGERQVREYRFSGNRRAIRLKSAHAALKMVESIALGQRKTEA